MKKLFLVLATCVCIFAQDLPKTKVIEDTSNLTILTPDLKQRSVLKIELPNKLQVYIVSDPGMHESCATLAVETGSWDDPADAMGLAHFCEHMLFMGTEKYPIEKEYHTFIKDHGGKNNAFTTDIYTAYMFSIKNAHFEETLDRFSQFFVAPLFNESGLEREKKAVHEEFMLWKEDDSFREWSAEKELGNPNHPNKQFNCGNLTTLENVTQESIKQWYQEHYSANLMRLVIYSPLPLEQLQTLVEKCFSPIKNKNLKASNILESMTTQERKKHILYLNPIKDEKELSINWELPLEMAQNRTHRLGHILAYILQNPNEHSLYTQLKSKQWIEEILAQESKEGKNYAIFNIGFKLTDQGIKHTDEILEMTFQTLKNMQTTPLPRHIFDDLQRRALLSYNYQQRQDAFALTYFEAHNILFEDLTTYPQKSSIIAQYDPELFARYVGELHFDNAMLTIVGKPEITQQTCDQKEHYTQAEYTLAPLDKQLTATIAQLENAPFVFPEKNPYLPTNLEPIEACAPNSQYITPLLIEESDMSKIYYAKDDRFFIPKVSMQLTIKTPKANYAYAKQAALMNLVVFATNEKLRETCRQAAYADLHGMVFPSSDGLKLFISGFDEKADTLLFNMLAKLQSLDLTKGEFNTYKSQLIREAKNAEKDRPVSQSFGLLRKTFVQDTFLPEEMKKAYEAIDYEDLVRYHKQLFSQVYIEGVLFGALSEEKARAIKDKLLLSFDAKSYPKSHHREKNVLILPENRGPFEFIKKSKVLGNAICLAIQDGALNLKQELMQKGLATALETPFFDELRTKQQTGYVVHAGSTQFENQCLTYFVVQSSTHTPQELLARFDLFLEDFVKNIHTNVTKERFENLKDAALKSLKQPMQTFDEASSTLYSYGFNHHGQFNRREEAIQIIENLTYEESIDFAKTFLSKQNKRRFAVLIEGKSDAHDILKYESVRSCKSLQKQGTFTSFDQEFYLEKTGTE